VAAQHYGVGWGYGMQNIKNSREDIQYAGEVIFGDRIASVPALLQLEGAIPSYYRYYCLCEALCEDNID
jgi:hypothetical protein